MSGVHINARHVPEGTAPTLDVLGVEHRLLADAGQTGGAFAQMIASVPPQAGPPPHVHHREDETFYILDGTFEFLVGDQTIAVSAGDYLVGPRDVPHTFRNVGDTPGRMLVTITPGGFEKFFVAVDQMAGKGAPDIPAILALGAEYGIEFLLPHH